MSMTNLKIVSVNSSWVYRRCDRNNFVIAYLLLPFKINLLTLSNFLYILYHMKFMLHKSVSVNFRSTCQLGTYAFFTNSLVANTLGFPRPKSLD